MGAPEQRLGRVRQADKNAPRTLAQEIDRLLKELPRQYDKVAAALRAARIPADRVYFSEYFDPTRHSLGTFCNPLIRIGAGDILPYTGNFTQYEAIQLGGSVTVQVLEVFPERFLGQVS